jgi:hypothetical protein
MKFRPLHDRPISVCRGAPHRDQHRQAAGAGETAAILGQQIADISPLAGRGKYYPCKVKSTVPGLSTTIVRPGS